MKAWGITDKGIKRANNQDFIYVGHNVFIVADGMGGHSAGEVASRLAVKKITENLEKKLKNVHEDDQVLQLIKEAIIYGNRKLREYAKIHTACADMGTTIAACVILLSKAFIANIGDSRTYLIRGGNIHQVTKDHSLVSEMLDRGQISAEEARFHPQKNVITRALGTDETVEIDFYMIDLMQDDILLLCSDGLTSVLEDQEILRILTFSTHYEEALSQLVNKVNELGGPDNISIIIIQDNSK